MAAVTAAVVGTVATVAVAGTQIAQSQGAMGGGGGSKPPDIKPLPEDPQDEAMKNYYARAMVANATKTYPGFGEFLQSGGDPAKAKFDLAMPEMKPSEAAAFGFVGGKGEDIPGISHEAAAGGMPGGLTTEQRMYLAEERRRKAKTQGQEPGPWSKRLKGLGGKIGRLEKKLETKFTPTPEVEPRESKIIAKLERLRGKQEEVANIGDEWRK
jgi:hypothetical protein